MVPKRPGMVSLAQACTPRDSMISSHGLVCGPLTGAPSSPSLLTRAGKSAAYFKAMVPPLLPPMTCTSLSLRWSSRPLMSDMTSSMDQGWFTAMGVDWLKPRMS